MLEQAGRSSTEVEKVSRQALEKRRATWEQALASNPSDPVAHDRLAWLLATASDPKFRDAKRAVELAKKAVELAPKEANYWNTLGVAQNRAGDSKAAIRALEKAIELDPKFAPAHFNLGGVLAREGKWPTAEAEYRKAVGLRPDWPGAHYQLGLVLWQQLGSKKGPGRSRRQADLSPATFP